MSQSPQHNQSRQSQSSGGNAYEETDQELCISGNTGTIILLEKLYLKIIKLKRNMKQTSKWRSYSIKTLKILINNLNSPRPVSNWETSQKKLFILEYTNVKIVEMFHVLHNKVALLMRRHSERGEQEILFKEFLERFGPYI